MIVLFTDFGPRGPYVGQMIAVLRRHAPEVAVVELLNDAPAHEPLAAAYLLAAFGDEFPTGSVFLCVVDPGVGGRRAPLVLEAAERWYVGPDNGLLALVARRAAPARWWRITWRPERLSATFHGRDLFAPVAAQLARGEAPPGETVADADTIGQDWPDDLAQVIYIDHFGNALTGLRARGLASGSTVTAGGRQLSRAGTFSEVPAGAAFWYENANGLAEIAVNQGRAADLLGLAVGSPVAVQGH